MKKLILYALRGYRWAISPMVGPACRYVPTCSEYAAEAVERYGVLGGGVRAAWRLLRCHPLSRKFGYDPVPEKTEATALQAGMGGQDASRSGVASREAHS